MLALCEKSFFYCFYFIISENYPIILELFLSCLLFPKLFWHILLVSIQIRRLNKRLCQLQQFVVADIHKNVAQNLYPLSSAMNGKQLQKH